MLRCGPGTLQQAVCVTVPVLQRIIRLKKAHAALRPGHATGDEHSYLTACRTFSTTVAGALTMSATSSCNASPAVGSISIN